MVSKRLPVGYRLPGLNLAQVGNDQKLPSDGSSVVYIGGREWSLTE